MELWEVLRWIHMFAGLAWWGEVFYINFVLTPALPKLEPAVKEKVMLELYPRMFRMATILSSLTISFGVLTALSLSGFDLTIFVNTYWGQLIFLGGSLGLFMFLLHMTVERVELKVLRYRKSGTGGELPSELRGLERRMTWLPRFGFLILTLVLVIMVYAAQGF